MVRINQFRYVKGNWLKAFSKKKKKLIEEDWESTALILVVRHCPILHKEENNTHQSGHNMS